jgi:hypothetical protein
MRDLFSMILSECELKAVATAQPPAQMCINDGSQKRSHAPASVKWV